MTTRLSTGMRNGLAGTLGFQGMFNKSYAEVYSGLQPASADAAKTGTLLGVVTLDGAALTKETRAVGSVTITGASGGSINSITVGGLNIIPDGAIAVSGDTNATLAAKLADAINRNGIMEARVSGAVVSIYGRLGTGVTTAAVTGSLTTATASYANMASGAAPVNGLVWAPPDTGVISKPSTAIWKFTGLAVGTAGWMRLYSSDTADTGGLLTGAPWYPRMDVACGVGSGEAQLSSLSVSVGSPHTVDSWTFTVPAQ